MKAKTLQIHWHDRQPIFSIDFEPCGKGRLATAGGDENVRIWKIIKENNEPPHIEYLSSLNRHTASVNVVRFSPKGAILASAGDDGNIILWQQSEQKEVLFGEEEDNFNKETWRIVSHKKPAIAVRCNPIKYKLRNYKKDDMDTGNSNASSPNKPKVNSFISLPYRLIYAVATQDSVLIYDTQQTTPLVLLTNLHYATFTDIAWSYDGCTLMLASTDGYCSIVSFEKGELGEPYESGKPIDLMNEEPVAIKTIVATIPTKIAQPSSTVNNVNIISQSSIKRKSQISQENSTTTLSSFSPLKADETEALQKFITPPETPSSSFDPEINNKRDFSEMSESVSTTTHTQIYNVTNSMITANSMSSMTNIIETKPSVSNDDKTTPLSPTQNKKKRRITPQLISGL
ncbi:hypothetical protein PIROE2DRAFT_8986 [Piromyces sp. E2]|nr:hypothetical protein PIROE2DRAFT_8986 [Piromyces sp. E2]|eukprot:OUM64299.1 hypothetical protein PIROE2DRAFT_8986 [Piromyces sp. E2]